MNKLDRITINPAVMTGRPCIRGMRVTVGNILNLLAAGRSRQEVLAAYVSSLCSVGSTPFSRFMQWRSHQRKPDHVATTDFQTLMAENHRAKALRFVLSKRPALRNPS